MDTLLQVSELHKAYNVPVLIDFDLELRAGEVHALMGSNGAGKSTLARILCGLTPYDSGRLELNGRPYDPHSREQAGQAGVVMVMQELNILPTLSIAENLFFHNLPARFGIVDRKRMRGMALDALECVRLDALDPDAPAGSLGVGQQQLVEIAGALAQECKLLILDEPTAALTDPEIDTLFRQMRELTGRGVAILYVSHRMDEIRRIADRVTVMRDGRRISTHDTAKVDQAVIVREMAGRDVWSQTTKSRDLSDAGIVLEVRSLCAPPKVRDLSFQLRQGEILGLAGLVGAGRTECLRAIFGADPFRSGEVLVRGKAVHIRHPAEAVREGICMVPEDRKGSGLLAGKGVRVNATLAAPDLYSRFGCLSREAETAAVKKGCAQLDIHCDGPEQSVSELSGGNQQKVVMLRWLLRDSEILLLDEPTRGVDVAAKESIYTLLRSMVREGKSVLIVSSELLELMSLCDRIAVFSDGRITEEFTPGTWSQEAITRAAFGAYLDTQS